MNLLAKLGLVLVLIASSRKPKSVVVSCWELLGAVGGQRWLTRVGLRQRRWRDPS
jgi:hypothetical protein